MIDWLQGLWISAKRSYGVMYWQGLLTNAVPLPDDPESNWAVGEGSNSAEQCVLIRYNLGWQDSECSVLMFSICEKL